MTPLAAGTLQVYPSSYADMDTPQDEAHHLLHLPTSSAPMDRSRSNTSSSSSKPLSEISDVEDDLMAQSPMGSPRTDLLGRGGGGGLLGSSLLGRTNGSSASTKSRSGRMSVAGGEFGSSRMGQSLTLREQEKVRLSALQGAIRQSAALLTRGRNNLVA